jgi:TetR/AcrR family transcriptional repressor of nem operon
LLGARNGENDHAARSQAILTFSALAGAMVLASAVSDERFSREILKTVAQLLNDPLRKGTSATFLR